jgi:4-amino-4-deoxy-L-arabinose transferase-like glycosyltransferase
MSAQIAGERADAQEAAPPASRRRRRLTSRQRNAIVFGIIGLAFLIPLRGLLRSQGPPMEEGFMLVFPERLLHGDLPNRDFLHLYGPGSLWALAGVYKVFGTSLTAERLVALLQQIGVVMGVYALARHWGRTVALPCALIALVIIVPPIGLTALGWVGGVALGLLGLAVALEGRRIDDPRRAGRYALLGGVLLGFALLYRLDLILAVGLAVLVMLRGLDRARAKRLLGGVALGASPYVIQLATAGVGATVSGMILDPVIYLRGGRRLPIPPPWDHLDGFLQRAGNIQQLSWPVPSFSTAQQLTIWFFFLLATVLFLLFVARWRLRQDRTAFNPRVLATVAVFSLGLMPQAIQRVDSAHFAWVSCVPIAFLPIAVTEVLRAWKPRLRVRARNVLAGAGVLLFLFAVLPYFTIRTYTDYSLQSFGYHRIAYKIEYKGRIFYYGRPEAARAANELLPVADRISKPGDRLFVGPTDLRKTPYSDAYLYYMLPDLDPATYYIEMDPGVANGSGSRLASDLRSADIAILSSVWSDWDEPNDARKFGSNRPNEILKRDFCLVETFGRGGVYELYRRCNK